MKHPHLKLNTGIRMVNKYLSFMLMLFAANYQGHPTVDGNGIENTFSYTTTFEA